MSNLFIVRGSQLLTPSVDVGILPGITRQFVLELATEARIPVEETRFRPDQLIAADEAYVRNEGSFEELLVAFLISDSFLYRK